MKEYYELNREQWIEEINKVISNANDLWILWNIYRFCVGMTAEEETA